jgi:hypothetical protein
MLHNLIMQDIEAGHGVGLIDPHGDLAASVIDQIPGWRSDDTAYFTPADTEFPVGLNVLRARQAPHLVASGIVGAFKSIWRDSWGPRLEYILYAATAALVEVENTSLLGIGRMLGDGDYRKRVVRLVKDPMVRTFWEKEFEGYDERFRREAIAPVQNKVGQLLMAAPIRNVLGQVKSKIDARFMMDNSRIFVANLAKGKLGEDKANLMGAMLLTQFQLAAMSRAELPEQQRRPFHLYVDEFHNFTTDSFSSILAESRKYGLSLTLSNQQTAQVREEIREAIFGNVGTIIAFRVGEGDARRLAREFGSDSTPEQFTSLSNYEVRIKLLSDGRQQDPFGGKTLPPRPIRRGRSEKIIRRSREKYATPRLVVEDKIARWLGH